MIASFLVPFVIGVGLTAVVVGLLLRAPERDAALESLLDLARHDDERFDEEAAEAGRDASALDLSNLTRGAVSWPDASSLRSTRKAPWPRARAGPHSAACR